MKYYKNGDFIPTYYQEKDGVLTSVWNASTTSSIERTSNYIIPVYMEACTEEEFTTAYNNAVNIIIKNNQTK